MAIKWDSETERYYIITNPKSKTKIYVNDNRSKVYKPSTKYLNELEKLLKNRSPTNDIKLFTFLNDKTVSNVKVGALLSKYKFTESDKFNKLYNASINFIKNWKTKMIFEIKNVTKALNTSVYELDLTPTKLPEHDDPLQILNDYFNTAMRTFIKFLGKENKQPRDYIYIVEVNNNQHTGRKGKFTVSVVLQEWNKTTLKTMLDRIESYIVSAQIVSLSNIGLTIKCYPVISGGAMSASLNEAIYTKRSIIRMTNDGNSCFWWSLILLLYQNSELYKKLKDLRYTKTLDLMAKQLCEECGYDYSKQVISDDMPDIISQINSVNMNKHFNIVILDIDNLPAFSTTTNITPSIRFKTHFKANECYYLLLDNHHYSPILNIKQFLNVRGFCSKCQYAYTDTDSFKKHECKQDNVETADYNKSKGKIRKDRKKFLGSTFKRENQDKRNEGHLRYIIWDIEVNQEKDADGYMRHKPNLIVAYEIIIPHGVIDEVEPFVDRLEPKIFEGYDSVQDFMSWVLCEQDRIKQCKNDSTVKYKKTLCIAHNSRGYDSRFILKYLDSKSIIPDKTIRANGGSSIQNISLKEGRISFIDSLNFFNEPLGNLPKTYNIQFSQKGYFPHAFNTKANENYNGSIPDIQYYHPEYTKIINHKGKLDFTNHNSLIQWHTEQVKNKVVFNLKDELLKYCIDDCKVLLKAVLIFRNNIIDKHIRTEIHEDGTETTIRMDLDPWREAITIPSLAQKINRNFFMPTNTIEAYTDSSKRHSMVADQWLYHLTESLNITIFPEFGLRVNFDKTTRELTTKLFGQKKLSVKVDNSVKFKYHFKSKASFSELSLDGYSNKTNTVYEFYGDYFHGNPQVNHKDMETAQNLYNATLEREVILKLLGFNLQTIWESDWTYEMNNFTTEYRNQIIQHIKESFIDPRHALHGGRTEVIRPHYKCIPGELIFGFDISSQYPAVMACDDYATKCKRIKKYTKEQLTYDILNDKFIGLIKCDVECPKGLFLPTLPSSDGSRLIFDLIDKKTQRRLLHLN